MASLTSLWRFRRQRLSRAKRRISCYQILSAEILRRFSPQDSLWRFRRQRLTRILALALVVSACRASFDNINKDKLLESEQNLSPPDERPVIPSGGDSAVLPTDFEILKRERYLSRAESAAYDCNGVIRVTESGPDRNRDKFLQSTEISDIDTECVPDGQCPGQSQGCTNAPSQTR